MPWEMFQQFCIKVVLQKICVAARLPNVVVGAVSEKAIG